MAQKAIPGTDRTVSAPVWAVGAVMVIVTIGKVMSSILSDLADYQAKVNGCITTIQTFAGGIF